MLLAVFLLLCISVFPIQLILCFRCKSLRIRIMPAVVLLLYIVFCVVIACASEQLMVQPDGRLAALIACFVGLFVLAGDGLAWAIYGIVKLVQKLRK